MHYTNFKLRKKTIHWFQCCWFCQFLEGSIIVPRDRDLHKPRSTNNRLGPLLLSSRNIAFCSRLCPFSGRTDTSWRWRKATVLWGVMHAFAHRATIIKPLVVILVRVSSSADVGWVRSCVWAEHRLPTASHFDRSAMVVLFFCVIRSKVESKYNISRYLCSKSFC